MRYHSKCQSDKGHVPSQSRDGHGSRKATPKPAYRDGYGQVPPPDRQTYTFCTRKGHDIYVCRSASLAFHAANAKANYSLVPGQWVHHGRNATVFRPPQDWVPVNPRLLIADAKAMQRTANGGLAPQPKRPKHDDVDDRLARLEAMIRRAVERLDHGQTYGRGRSRDRSPSRNDAGHRRGNSRGRSQDRPNGKHAGKGRGKVTDRRPNNGPQTNRFPNASLAGPVMEIALTTATPPGLTTSITTSVDNVALVARVPTLTANAVVALAMVVLNLTPTRTLTITRCFRLLQSRRVL